VAAVVCSESRLRSSIARWAATVGLGVVLACAQTIAVAHDFDLESHMPDHTCEICMATANLVAGDVGPVQIVAAACLHAGRAMPQFARDDSPRLYTELARAPPLV
jgi:hypothetical protein